MLIKGTKDFWAAVIYLVIGIATVVIARDYPLGTATKMGPAYFPSILGALLIVVGVLALIRSFRVDVEGEIGAFAWRGLLFITVSVILFGVLARGAGLVPAVIVLILLSARGSAKFRWEIKAMSLAALLTGFCALVFIKALGVPLPLIGPWLKG